MTIRPNRCVACSRRIAPALDRYLIRGQHIVCSPRIHNRDRRRRMHNLAAPACAIPWHDVWDHPEDILSGAREAIQQLLEQHHSPGPAYTTRSTAR